MQAARDVLVSLKSHCPSILTTLRVSLVLAAVAVGGAACETKNLHPVHGLRFHEMMTAQQNARGTHDPAARGDEATLPIQAYYLKLSGDQQGGGAGMGGGMQQPSNATAGVKPLVH